MTSENSNSFHVNQRIYKVVVLGAVLSFLSVTAGAFGAHGAKLILPQNLLSIYETAVRYQTYHSFAILFAGLLLAVPIPFNIKYLKIAVYSFLAGIVLFSGSLYLYAFTGIKQLGMITPVGGVLLLIGWLFIALSVKPTAPE